MAITNQELREYIREEIDCIREGGEIGEGPYDGFWKDVEDRAFKYYWKYTSGYGLDFLVEEAMHNVLREKGYREEDLYTEEDK